MKEKNLTSKECKIIQENREKEKSLALYDDGYTERVLEFSRNKLILKIINNGCGCGFREEEIVLAKNKTELLNICNFLNNKL